MADWDDYGYEPGDDWDDDGYQEYKDDLAQGRIYEDGTRRDPDEPDFGREDYERYAAMSPLGRAACVIRSVASAWWLLVRGRATTDSDEPPF